MFNEKQIERFESSSLLKSNNVMDITPGAQVSFVYRLFSDKKDTVKLKVSGVCIGRNKSMFTLMSSFNSGVKILRDFFLFGDKIESFVLYSRSNKSSKKTYWVFEKEINKI